MENELEINVNWRCPHCEVELTAEELKSLWSSYTTSLRTTLGGPKRIPRPCQTCGMTCKTAREAWSHCRIPRNLDSKALVAYVLDRAPKELGPGFIRSHFGDLEALQATVADVLKKKDLKPAEKRQAKWYLHFIDRAMDKMENVA